MAYRLALVAVGEGVAAVSLNGPHSWDVGAGHALVRAAGGVLRTGRRGGSLEEVAYDVQGHCRTADCFGGAAAAVELIGRRDWRGVYGRAHAAARPPYRRVRLAPGHAVRDAGRLARAQGCLLGQLAGDALGGLVEFQSERDIRTQHPQGVRRLADGGTWRNLAGQPTDDSEMALLLARTMVNEGRYDPGAALEAYVHWYEGGPFDIGGTTQQALSAAQGATRQERLEGARRAANRDSEANGSLMRISPLGILGAGRAAEAAGWAREDSRSTHPHPVCQDACAAMVVALAQAIDRGGSPAECHAAALDEARRSNAQASVCEALEAAAAGPPPNYQRQMGWVLIALQNAFHQLLHAPSLEEGVVDTVMRGGDTDTNAAIAGALLGAVHGREAIPAQWRLALLACHPIEAAAARHPRGEEYWPVDALELAERLLLGSR